LTQDLITEIATQPSSHCQKEQSEKRERTWSNRTKQLDEGIVNDDTKGMGLGKETEDEDSWR
jgi:hypothetical protein